MNKVQQLFFSIIRSALGNRPMEGPIGLSPKQWKQLYRLSSEQSLSVLVFKELSKLGNDMPESIRNGWKEHVDYCLARFDAQLMGLTHISQFLEENGIRTMVLKGLGLALLYPKPQARECSDVDIFCFGEYERVNALLKEHGLISGIIEENDKHCNFSFDGINMENHRYFSEYVNRANVIMGEEISSLSETGLHTDSRIPGIFFPGPQMGALHLTMHTLSHLAWSGITVRHLLDCGLFFNRYADKLGRDRMLRLWNDAGIADAAFSICVLCEELLGIDTGMLGENRSGYEKTADVILNGILNPCHSSSEVWDPFSKFYRKYRRFRFRSVMHRTVYGVPFPDSFWKSFAFLKRWTS